MIDLKLQDILDGNNIDEIIMKFKKILIQDDLLIDYYFYIFTVKLFFKLIISMISIILNQLIYFLMEYLVIQKL